MNRQLILLFTNVHKVMKADQALRSRGFSSRVIPVPEYISSECGMCLLFDDDNPERYKEVLEEQNIQFEIHKPGV